VKEREETMVSATFTRTKIMSSGKIPLKKEYYHMFTYSTSKVITRRNTTSSLFVK
jgi:hypothetical protein